MELTKVDFNIIREYIHKVCGIDLDDDKEYLVTQRLESIAIAQGCQNFHEFALLLRAFHDQVLLDQVVVAITTNETSFFRDGHPYELFRSVILPKLAAIANARKDRTFDRKGAKISILSAGSSTGQEPYSQSIAIHEFIQSNPGLNLIPSDFVIVATDISSRVLSKAMTGEYTDFEINRGLTEFQKAIYFTHEKNVWSIKDNIRSIIEFRRLNLTESFLHLGGFDAIFCRNVLIYFDIETRQKIFAQFHQMLSDKGILILGSTENVYGVSDKFESFHTGSSVYYENKR